MYNILFTGFKTYLILNTLIYDTVFISGKYSLVRYIFYLNFSYQDEESKVSQKFLIGES